MSIIENNIVVWEAGCGLRQVKDMIRWREPIGRSKSEAETAMIKRLLEW